MEARSWGEFMDLKRVDHGSRKRIRSHSLRPMGRQCHDYEIDSAPPRRIVDIREPREDASISLIAGILTEMTTLLTTESN